MVKKKHGFTLLETMMTLALTVIIVGILYSMFVTGNKVFSDSDVKSTLQIEGQAIQEKISDAGMQAISIKSLTLNNNQELEDIKFNNYIDEQGTIGTFDIRTEDTQKLYKDGSHIYNIYIGNQLVSSNVESVKLDINNVNAQALQNVNSIEFNIWLRKEKGYSNVDQKLDFRVAFRNR